MDSDLFTTGGDYADYSGGMWGSKTTPWSSTQDVGEVYHQAKLLLRWVRLATVLVIVLLLVAIFYSAVVFVPSAWKTWKGVDKLQYLGASTSVVRDDLGWPTNDSLAETAMRNQNRVTDFSTAVPVAKAAFTAREQMRSPEEELLASQKK